MNRIRKSQVVSQRKVMISKRNSEKIKCNKEMNSKHTRGLRISLFLRFVQSVEGHKTSSILQRMVAKGRCIFKRRRGGCWKHPLMDWFLEGKQIFF